MSDSPTRRAAQRSYPEFRRNRQPGVLQQIGAVMLHPAAFFRTLPPMAQTRQWLWAALIILALVGFSAVQQQSAGVEVPPLPDVPGGAPISERLTVALVAASVLIIEWLLQGVVFAEASLLSGRSPDMGRNIQVAIWAAVPLGVMAAVQIAYMAAGGVIGEPGLGGLVTALPGYPGYPGVIQTVLSVVAGRLTLFWLWNLALLYFGLRHALQARPAAALFTLAAWVGLVIVLPVLGSLLTGG
jgi:hypothetical protein